MFMRILIQEVITPVTPPEPATPAPASEVLFGGMAIGQAAVFTTIGIIVLIVLLNTLAAGMSRMTRGAFPPNTLADHLRLDSLLIWGFIYSISLAVLSSNFVVLWVIAVVGPIYIWSDIYFAGRGRGKPLLNGDSEPAAAKPKAVKAE